MRTAVCTYAFFSRLLLFSVTLLLISCSATKAPEPRAAQCGDGVPSGDEVCDDGNQVSETACAYGERTCVACNDACSEVYSMAGAWCGDGIVNGDEACDDGNAVTEGACPEGTGACTLCNADCSKELNLTGPVCGDGVVNGSEVCDDGNTDTETRCPGGAGSHAY